MRHYSDAIVNVISNTNKVVYFSNYKSNINCSNEIVWLSLNPLDIRNYAGLVYIVYYLFKTKNKTIHLNSGYPILFFIYPLFYFFNSIITIHDAVSHKGESFLKKIVHKMQLVAYSLFFKKIIVHSDIIKRQLPSFINRNKIFVIPHINYNHLFQNNHAKGLSVKNKFTVLFFGRILEYKGLKYLINAFNNLDENKYELIIAGEGDIGIHINKKNIKVINRFISDSEIPNLFNNTDVVVVPYIEASQSGVIYLSFAYSKPVIATNVGSLDDIVNDGENGYVVRPKSSRELFLAIKKISNPLVYSKFTNNIKNVEISSNSYIENKLNNLYK